jgi:hypothetical protein
MELLGHGVREYMPRGIASPQIKDKLFLKNSFLGRKPCAILRRRRRDSQPGWIAVLLDQKSRCHSGELCPATEVESELRAI